MNSIQEVVNAKVAEMIDSGVIQNKSEDLIQQSIESQFRSYSSITKQLESEFEKGLEIDTSKIEFETYNQVMLSAIKAELNRYFAEESSSKFMEQPR